MSDTETVPDVQEQSVADPEGTNETAPAEQPKAPKIDPTHACLCSTYELVDRKDADTVFNTGCTQTTKSVFAQGHDARLVSFLVEGFMDGYGIRQLIEGKYVQHATPADAAGVASAKLRAKAEAATQNATDRQSVKDAKNQEREEAKAKKAAEKAERDAKKAEEKAAKAAEKANAPKAVGAEVVAGTSEGDQTALAEGQTKIKVGRWEYNATIDDAGNATYLDGAGATQTVERDGYRLLETAQA